MSIPFAKIVCEFFVNSYQVNPKHIKIEMYLGLTHTYEQKIYMQIPIACIINKFNMFDVNKLFVASMTPNKF